ncbi:MAG: acetolactate decarboxylase [Armatimonadetes bacterium]|nr:acetolactate decarboxylase [Armatimonadota bacterium]
MQRRSWSWLGWMAAAVVVAGCSSSTTPALAESRLRAYNSVNDLLAGDLWDVSRRARVISDLRDVPAGWPIVGIGTTDRALRNGEIVVRGTASAPSILYTDPDQRGAATQVNEDGLPFIAVAACDPAKMVSITATAGQTLHDQVKAAAAAQGWEYAAVSVTGRFNTVSYSVAYDLRKEGSPLDDPNTVVSNYLRLFTAPDEAPWSFGGFYASNTSGQALLSIGGKAVHLHGTTDDLTRGGHLGAATVVNAEIRIWPLTRRDLYQVDLTADQVEVFGDIVTYRVRNLGANEAARVPVLVKNGATVLYSGTLGPLGPGASRILQVIATDAVTAANVSVTVDPDKAIAESDETNNTASP